MSEIEPAAAHLPLDLVQGYEAFLTGRFPTERQRFQALAETGQNPRIMLIGCCDSRVSPEVIFDASPGEIFVLRNVAALVPPYGPDNAYHGTSAALEFGVLGLRVAHIVILGHQSCGGVKAYAEAGVEPFSRPLSSSDFIGQWIKLIAPAADAIGSPADRPDAPYIERLAFQSVRLSVANLRTFPWIRALEEKGLLSLHGAYFAINDGRLLALDEASGLFRPVAEEAWRKAFAAPGF